MPRILVTDEFIRCAKGLPTFIQKKLSKQEELFRLNPFHPSLHTEKLQPHEKKYWSFRVDRSYRVLFRFAHEDAVVLITVGPHDGLYKSIR